MIKNKELEKTILEKINKIENINLYYVDYNEDISPDYFKEIIENDFQTDPYELYDYGDVIESIDSYLKENLTEEEFAYMSEKLLDECREIIEAKDESDIIWDLLRNTNDYTISIHTDLYITAGWQNDDYEKDLKEIFKKIGLNIKDENVKKEIKGLMRESQGGELIMLVKPDIEKFFYDFKNIIDQSKKGDLTKIIIEKPIFAIEDRVNGGGDISDDSGYIDKIEITVKNPKNYINIQGTDPYDILNVYGETSSSNLYFGGDVELEKTKAKESTLEENSDRIDLMNNRKEWDKRLKKDKNDCDYFDERYSSHNCEYRNDYPAGNKCKNCGKFFID